jgi:hypothetical protein
MIHLSLVDEHLPDVCQRRDARSNGNNELRALSSEAAEEASRGWDWLSVTGRRDQEELEIRSLPTGAQAIRRFWNAQ